MLLFVFCPVQSLLDDDENKASKQQAGFKSAMLADVRPSTDGRVQHGISLFLLLILFFFCYSCSSFLTFKITYYMVGYYYHQLVFKQPSGYDIF